MTSWIYDSRSDRKSDTVVNRSPKLENTPSEFANQIDSGAVLTKFSFTLLKTVRDRSLSVRRLWRFDDKSINDALEIATSPVVNESYSEIIIINVPRLTA